MDICKDVTKYKHNSVERKKQNDLPAIFGSEHSWILFQNTMLERSWLMARCSFWKYVWESTLGTTSELPIFLFVCCLCVCPCTVMCWRACPCHSHMWRSEDSFYCQSSSFPLSQALLVVCNCIQGRLDALWVSTDSPALVPFYNSILGVCMFP